MLRLLRMESIPNIHFISECTREKGNNINAIKCLKKKNAIDKRMEISADTSIKGIIPNPRIVTMMTDPTSIMETRPSIAVANKARICIVLNPLKPIERDKNTKAKI